MFTWCVHPYDYWCSYVVLPQPVSVGHSPSRATCSTIRYSRTSRSRGRAGGAAGQRVPFVPRAGGTRDNGTAGQGEGRDDRAPGAGHEAATSRVIGHRGLQGESASAAGVAGAAGSPSGRRDSHLAQWPSRNYSITSAAKIWSEAGIAMPRASAVLRLNHQIELCGLPKKW